jgi:Protein of unknown function (DUF3826)
MFRRSFATYQVIFFVGFMAMLGGRASAANAIDSEAAYTQEITKRADKILAPLEISDNAAKMRVRDLIVQQYKYLRKIHDARDAKMDEAKRTPTGGGAVFDAWIKVARDTANIKLMDVHRRFVARLAVELAPEQVDKVKDGMTYGVVDITYNRYLELFPNLMDDQKREILAQLIEAREYAMDAGSSEEKHAFFGKYKGRINNYLSSAGYNIKQAEKDLAEKQKNASKNR